MLPKNFQEVVLTSTIPDMYPIQTEVHGALTLES